MSVWHTSLGGDVRYGVRALRRTPAFTLGALSTVALAVGATTAIFSLAYAVLVRQLPYAEPDRVVWIWSDQPGRDRTPFNVPDFLDYRDQARTLAGFAGYFAAGANLSDEAAAERVQGLRATGNLFEVLGASAVVGRLLQPRDAAAGAPGVVVLSEPFWTRRFGRDRGIVGQSIRLDGEPHTVVGVVTAGFATPIRGIEFVLPFSPDLDRRRGARNSFNFIHGVGRLAPGVSPAQASDELVAIARRLQAAFPVENARKRGVRLVGVLEGVSGPFRVALVTLSAGVVAVLLIACANLATLQLVRVASRGPEHAVRLALGSSRGGLVRQLLVESLIVSAAGGAVGVLVARWGVTGLAALAPTTLPRLGETPLDGVVLTMALVVSAASGVLSGVFPAVAGARTDIREALQDGTRGATRGGGRLRSLLVGVEVALAASLLVVVVLLGKSFANVLGVGPGFDGTQVLSARLSLPPSRYRTAEAISTFQRAVAARLAALPAVSDTGAVSMLPLSGLLSRVPFTIEGRPVEPERVPLAQFRMVTAGYFETARIPVTRGRAIVESDGSASRPVAVVSESLARDWLRGIDPIGARVLVDDNDGAPRPLEIVGVVGDVQQVALDAPATWDIYLPYAQVHADNIGTAAAYMFWLVRAAGAPMALAAQLIEAVKRVDAGVAASQVRPLEAYVSDSVSPRRFSLWLMAAFALAALALAGTGIYAVVACSIGERTRELGIRAALGASPGSLVRLVMGAAAPAAVLGLAAGLGLAAVCARLLASLLFNVAPTDSVTLVEVGAFVGGLAALACAAPAARINRTLARMSLSRWP
jgi:putative ABC transport system permease protein